jgi:hypothetical protein
VIEKFKVSLVFATLVASAVHMLVHLLSSGAPIPFAADVGFLVAALIPIAYAVHRFW